MEAWSAHHLFQHAEATLGMDSAKNIKEYAQKLRLANLPVIFTLNHLSNIVDVEYKFLHETVNRRRESANYKMFAIKKRSGGRRFIHAVSERLYKTQQFLNLELLQKIIPHPASYAFHPTGGIKKCAWEHCGARWLFQFDIKNFFYNISEISVYTTFLKAGYRSLLSFELARICTTTRLPLHLSHLLHYSNSPHGDDYNFYNNNFGAIGVLPQGAPTSPMLSNIAATHLDDTLTIFAQRHCLTYTRYADDITFSAGSDLPKHLSIGNIQRSVIALIRECGFIANEMKTRVAGPGSRKIVLGLLVDGAEPRISKNTLKRIDRHLHATLKYGLVDAALHEGFDSPIGYYNHLRGLIAFLKDVDLLRWKKFSNRFSEVPPPC